MSPCESHVACVIRAVSIEQADVCVSAGELDLFEGIMRRSTSKRTMWSFLVRKRVCNTICTLNGARQRVRGSPCITTAPILQETTVGVRHGSVSSCRFVQVMNDILTPCHPTSPYYQRISCYNQDRSDVMWPYNSLAFYFQTSQHQHSRHDCRWLNQTK